MESDEQVCETDVSIEDNEKNPPSALNSISEKYDSDIFVYSGPISREYAEIFVAEVEKGFSYKSKNCILIISTFGGDPDAAYIIARILKYTYEKFYIYIYGMCKSAGTLLVLGADEIIMSHRGELGPLDVQVLKEDEILTSNSGLDISKAINSLRDKAFEIFESNFLELKRRSGGNITTKTAGEIAVSLAVGLISPITAQIDPLKLGEIQRAIDVAYHYGVRLGADAEIILRLIKTYPSHSFVIDFEEAKELLGYVRYPEPIEFMMEKELRFSLFQEFREDCIRYPHSNGFICSFYRKLKEKDEEACNDDQDSENNEGADNEEYEEEIDQEESDRGVQTDTEPTSEGVCNENQDRQ